MAFSWGLHTFLELGYFELDFSSFCNCSLQSIYGFVLFVFFFIAGSSVEMAVN